jgi:hypothetical protein
MRCSLGVSEEIAASIFYPGADGSTFLPTLGVTIHRITRCYIQGDSGFAYFGCPDCTNPTPIV